jgi:hypothetical protein
MVSGNENSDSLQSICEMKNNNEIAHFHFLRFLSELPVVRDCSNNDIYIKKVSRWCSKINREWFFFDWIIDCCLKTSESLFSFPDTMAFNNWKRWKLQASSGFYLYCNGKMKLFLCKYHYLNNPSQLVIRLRIEGNGNERFHCCSSSHKYSDVKRNFWIYMNISLFIREVGIEPH